MWQRPMQARRHAQSRRVRRWRRRLLVATVAVALLGGLVTFLGLNYGWSGAVREGDQAPAFALDDHEGRRVNLADYLGKKPVVFVFYMTYG